MTAPSRKSAGSSGLLGRLMTEVRSEFRSDVLEFAADDPVFGTAACRAAGCGRTARGRGLCQGHLQRWNDQGRPDLEQFVVSTDPRWRRQQPNQRCRVAGCGYGCARGGMCGLHAQRWARAGRPDLVAWLADPPPVTQPAAGSAWECDYRRKVVGSTTTSAEPTCGRTDPPKRESAPGTHQLGRIRRESVEDFSPRARQLTR